MCLKTKNSDVQAEFQCSSFSAHHACQQGPNFPTLSSHCLARRDESLRERGRTRKDVKTTRVQICKPTWDGPCLRFWLLVYASRSVLLIFGYSRFNVPDRIYEGFELSVRVHVQLVLGELLRGREGSSMTGVISSSNTFTLSIPAFVRY